eukprot:6691884-Heterocapsa_arctica.AAC.1
MDRPNDARGSSSTNPPILIVPDIPTVRAEAPRVPTMPARAERAARKDVDMAVITLGRAARTAEKYKGILGDGGAAARRKPDVAE